MRQALDDRNPPGRGDVSVKPRSATQYPFCMRPIIGTSMSTAKIVQLCEHHHRTGRVIERKMRGGILSEGGFHAQSHAKFPFDLFPTDANFFGGAPNAHSYRADRGFGRCV